MARKKAARKAAPKATPRKTAKKAASKPVSRAAALGPEQSLGPHIDKVSAVAKNLKSLQASAAAAGVQTELNAAISSLEDASAKLVAACRRARKVVGS